MRLPPGAKRAAVTQRTLDKYRGKPFDWSKRWTCLHVLNFHLRGMGVKVPALPKIAGVLAAKRELKARGCETMADILDGILPRRRAVAFMQIGDIGYRASADGIGGILVCVSAGAMFGWFEDLAGAEVMMMDIGQVEAVWDVQGS